MVSLDVDILAPKLDHSLAAQRMRIEWGTAFATLKRKINLTSAPHIALQSVPYWFLCKFYSFFRMEGCHSNVLFITELSEVADQL